MAVPPRIPQHPEVTWCVVPFQGLSPQALQRIHVARQQVFVVEQQCVFQDADPADECAVHLAGWRDDGVLLAYARLLPPGVKAAEPSIGRVLTTAAARGQGLGRVLMRRAIDEMRSLHPRWDIRIAAQQRLQHFYAAQGFAVTGLPYVEDGIAHVDMLLAPASGT